MTTPKLKPNWIRVDSYKEIPNGNWLVFMDEDFHGSFIQSACIRGNFQLIGHSFAFNAGKVVAYCEEIDSPD